MLNILSDRILKLLIKDEVVDENIIEAYRYGLQIMILNIWGISLVLIIGILLNVMVETLIFILLFVFTRRFTGGYHASKIWQCSLMTSSTFLTIIILYKTIELSLAVNIIIVVFSFIIFALFSPVENKNKPLNAKLKKKCKLISCGLLLFESAIGFGGYALNYKISGIVFLTILSVSAFIIISKIKEGRKNNEKSI